MEALGSRGYDVVPIGITKTGRWQLSGVRYMLPADPSVGGLVPLENGGRAAWTRAKKHTTHRPLDIVFPVVHGTGGEDGTLQGLLDLADMPYVGAGVLGSALGMDKVAMKAAFRMAGLPIVDYRVVRRRDLENPEPIVGRLEEAFRYPCFVKPSNGGSSVGVTKAGDRRGLVDGLNLAARYDRKIVVERAIDAREIE